MALTGHLSDLSLSELIEFFCNQRKSGRLKVLYPNGAGYFYLQAGSVVDARIGVLHGIDAVYYALTLPNAEFEFSADAEARQSHDQSTVDASSARRFATVGREHRSECRFSSGLMCRNQMNSRVLPVESHSSRS